MPRSFLVKKYFSSKKPNYSQLESQSGESYFIHPMTFFTMRADFWVHKLFLFPFSLHYYG